MTDNQRCPDCGGYLTIHEDGTRECLLLADGVIWSCGWREKPLFELVDPAP
jgi:hypothetical protein